MYGLVNETTLIFLKCRVVAISNMIDILYYTVVLEERIARKLVQKVIIMTGLANLM